MACAAIQVEYRQAGLACVAVQAEEGFVLSVCKLSKQPLRPSPRPHRGEGFDGQDQQLFRSHLVSRGNGLQVLTCVDAGDSSCEGGMLTPN